MIRQMKKEDIDKILIIENQSFSDPWTQNMFQSLFSSKMYQNFVIEENNQILGYMSIIATMYGVEILNIAIDKDFRNRGLASMLIKNAVLVAKDLGCDVVLLEARKSNIPAINLYKKNGFKIDGIRPKYYGDEDAILMSLIVEV